MENSGNYSHDTDGFYCGRCYGGAISLYGRESCRMQQQEPQAGNRSSRRVRKSDHPGDEFQLRSLASAETGRKWWYPYLFPDISHRRWGRGYSGYDRCAECAGNTGHGPYSSRCRCHRKYRCSDRWGCSRSIPFRTADR